MEYLRGNQDQTVLPGGKNDARLMYYVNTLLAVQPSMRSYTGGKLEMGRGSPIVALGKPKLNKKSLNECELVGVNESVLQDVQRDCGDALPLSKMRYTCLEAYEEEFVNDMWPIMLWTCNFLLEQGYKIIEDLLLDNKSPIMLEQYGKN